jgi:hypothetical protein
MLFAKRVEGIVARDEQMEKHSSKSIASGLLAKSPSGILVKELHIKKVRQKLVNPGIKGITEVDLTKLSCD